LATIALIIANFAYNFKLRQQITAINFDANQFYNCNEMILTTQSNTIVSCVLVMLLMAQLVRYIADLIPFLYLFVQIISNLLSEVFSLAFIVVWVFIILAIFGTYTFGAFFPYLTQFSYFYSALILLVLRKNVFFPNTESINYYITMGEDIGTFSIYFLFIFSYCIITFVILKIIIAIVIKAMKSAEEKIRKEIKRREKINKSAGLLDTNAFLGKLFGGGDDDKD